MSPKLTTIATVLLLCLNCTHTSSNTTSGPNDTNIEDNNPAESATGRTIQTESHDQCQYPQPVKHPKWFHTAVGYEIFVRSFYDSNADGIGDLKGVIQKLDYLNDGMQDSQNDLGISLIWLMPIFESPSYHGYDTTSYEEVNPDYGSTADLKQLLDEAHKRGIKVILDLVLNHTSDKHPWFLDSASSKSSKYRDWYVWSDSYLDWKKPFGSGPVWHEKNGSYYYGLFSASMPDLNYLNPEVKDEAKSIAVKWLGIGVDGFRLDAVRYIIENGPNQLADTPQTIAWWIEFSQYVYASYPDVLLLAEAWASNKIASLYQANSAGVNMTFDFQLRDAIVVGLQGEDLEDVDRTICQLGKYFSPDSARAIFLSNHDLIRLASQLPDKKKLRLAAALLFSLPGTPFIYYGQEIGMKNGPTNDDKDKRRPMQWSNSTHAGFSSAKPWYTINQDYKTVNVASQQKDKTSLWWLYKNLISFRTKHKALSLGGYRPVQTYPALAFVRYTSNSECFCSFNPTQDPVFVQYQVGSYGEVFEEGAELKDNGVKLAPCGFALACTK